MRLPRRLLHPKCQRSSWSVSVKIAHLAQKWQLTLLCSQVPGRAPSPTIICVVFIFIFCSDHSELNGNTIGTTTSTFFKPLRAVLISAVYHRASYYPLLSCLVWEYVRNFRYFRSTFLPLWIFLYRFRNQCEVSISSVYSSPSSGMGTRSQESLQTQQTHCEMGFDQDSICHLASKCPYVNRRAIVALWMPWY